MNHIDRLRADQLAYDRALIALGDELIDEPQGSFRKAPGKTSTDSEYQPVNPQVRNKKDPVEVSWKQFLELASCSGVDDQPRIDSAGAQQAKIAQRKKGLAAEVCGGVFRYNTDLHIGLGRTEDLVVSHYL